MTDDTYDPVICDNHKFEVVGVQDEQRSDNNYLLTVIYRCEKCEAWTVTGLHEDSVVDPPTTNVTGHEIANIGSQSTNAKMVIAAFVGLAAIILVAVLVNILFELVINLPL